MKIPFTGLELRRQKAAVAPTDLSATHRNNWFPLLREGGPGWWQRSITIDSQTALTFPALYACITLIAGDVAKLRQHLLEESPDGIRRPTHNPAYSPVLRKPNRYENGIQFRTHWLMSKLAFGNVYALKVRDNRGVVVALYVLDPACVTPLEAPGAAVFYRLQADHITTVGEAVTVPASEIIHDRIYHPSSHPLIGVSPISACGLASQQGLEIMRTSTRFFENGARPGGMLSAPGTIGKETAERLKQQWDSNFGGDNVGKVAVLGDGLKYESLSVNPVDAQLIDQLKMSALQVCTAFKVPAFLVNVGETPKYENASVQNQIYYSRVLQLLIDEYELCMSEGLNLPPRLAVDLDEDDLIKMDPEMQARVDKELVAAKIKTPNEARKRWNLPGLDGGDSLWGQKQDHSLAALAKRDEQLIDMMDDADGGPFLPRPQEVLPAPANDEPDIDAERAAQLLEKALA